MKRFFLLLALFAFLLTPLAARAQSLLGTVVNTLPIAPAKVLADPVRDRVYAVVPGDNTLQIINTLDTTVTTIQLPVDSIPIDMALSRDNSTLYIANSGSTVRAVSVVRNLDADTPTFSDTDSISLGGPGLGIAATVDSSTGDDILFVLTTEQIINDTTTPPTVTVITPVLVVDAVTHATLSQVGENNVTHSFVGTNLDGTSVVVAGSLGLETFSVATGKRTAANPTVGATAIQLISSNTGAYLCLPDPAGNNNGVPLTTLLFDAVNPPGYYGTFSDPATPGPLAFSPADDLVYQLRFDATVGPEVLVFDTAKFIEVGSAAVDINANGLTVSATGRNTIALEHTGSLLFLGASTSFNTNSAGQLVILTTGTGPLDPFLPPVITTTTLPDGAVGQPYDAAVVATHAPTSYGATGLPNGLSIDTTTGEITGTPTTGGVFTVTLTATNAYGSTTGTATLTITGTSIPVPVITSATTATDPVGAPFTYQITASNGPTSFGATGLPTGLTINTTTGVISGTPVAAGTFSVILSASNAGGTGMAPLTLTVTLPAPPVITSATTATDQIDTAFTYQITATNSPTSFVAIGLPTGLTLDMTSGMISGTPTDSGTFSISLRATNQGGTGTAILKLTVTPLPAPTITSPAASTGTVDQTFSYQATATNTPSSFAASGLPSGLSINTTTGLISGTPLVAGTFTATLTATNASATGVLALTLTIASNVPTVEIMATVPRVTAGTGDHAAVTISRTGDLSQPLIVAYSIKGSARNGTDYYTLSGKQKIKANRASATIQIIPKDTFSGDTARGIKLTLLYAVTYQPGNATKAKVTILPGE